MFPNGVKPYCHDIKPEEKHMALEQRIVYCHKIHADFKRSDEKAYGLMDLVKDGEVIAAKDRPEACAYVDYHDVGVKKYYVKRDMRRTFFNPKTSDVHEQKIQVNGNPKWTFTEVNADCMFHYLRFLETGLEGELSNARRAQQS